MISFIFLFLESYGVRKLEALFASFITIMALSFAWMFADTSPSGKELLIGSIAYFRHKDGCKQIDPANIISTIKRKLFAYNLNHNKNHRFFISESTFSN